MAKKVQGYIKLQVPAGSANPSPPIGPALGQQGVNIMEFCKQFNAQTQKMEKGLPIPVVITVYADRSFTFVMKTPPAAVLIAKAIGIEKGSGTPNTAKVGKISRKQLEEIAKTQATRPHRRRSGRRGPHHRGLRAQHGRRCGGGLTMAVAKRMKAWAAKLTPGKAYPVEEALKLVKEFADRQVRRGRGCLGEPGDRCQQVRPAGARLDRDAPRHRQDGARRGVYLG